MTRNKNEGRSDGTNETSVDATLELDIRQVEQAVDEYLSNPGVVQREELVSQLAALDDQLSKSDFYESSIFGSGIFGLGSRGMVIGETSGEPFVEEVQTAEFRAQIALVKAAKLEIEAPTPKTMDDLRASSQDLKSRCPNPSQIAGTWARRLPQLPVPLRHFCNDFDWLDISFLPRDSEVDDGDRS